MLSQLSRDISQLVHRRGTSSCTYTFPPRSVCTYVDGWLLHVVCLAKAPLISPGSPLNYTAGRLFYYTNLRTYNVYAIHSARRYNAKINTFIYVQSSVVAAFSGVVYYIIYPCECTRCYNNNNIRSFSSRRSPDARRGRFRDYISFTRR